MTTQTAKRYNIVGTAEDISVIQTQSGGRFARFKLNRGAKGMLSAKMTDKALVKFEAAGFGPGASVDCYGVYEKSTWTNSQGQMVTTDVFVVLSVSAPKTKDEIEALRAAKAARQGGETAPAAVAQTTDEEIPF